MLTVENLSLGMHVHNSLHPIVITNLTSNKVSTHRSYSKYTSEENQAPALSVSDKKELQKDEY